MVMIGPHEATPQIKRVASAVSLTDNAADLSLDADQDVASRYVSKDENVDHADWICFGAQTIERKRLMECQSPGTKFAGCNAHLSSKHLREVTGA
jgi:hypothetical protein